MTTEFDAAFWDRMYQHRHGAWDGEPNGFLAEQTADLAPGAALDLGCGEGADALWLASRGWRVTAVDLSGVALAHAREADTTQAVSWLQADMFAWEPPVEAFDLISLHYVHVPPGSRAALFGRLARAMRPGGTLLVVAHHPSDHETDLGRPAIADLYFTADEVAAMLPEDWEVLVSGTKPQTVTKGEGKSLTIQDMVFKARRRA